MRRTSCATGWLVLEEGVAGADELFEIAGGEDESGSGAGVALGQGEAEATGAPGDEDDLVGGACRGGEA